MVTEALEAIGDHRSILRRHKSARIYRWGHLLRADITPVALYQSVEAIGGFFD